MPPLTKSSGRAKSLILRAQERGQNPPFLTQRLWQGVCVQCARQIELSLHLCEWLLKIAIASTQGVFLADRAGFGLVGFEADCVVEGETGFVTSTYRGIDFSNACFSCSIER